MKKYAITPVILIFCYCCVFAMSGKIILISGHVIKGDIRKMENGSYWVSTRSGSVKYDKSEIKKVVIYSKRDKVSESFITSLKITPGQPNTGVTRANTQYDNVINKEANKNNIDPNLIKAVIKAESNFNKSGVSSKGACGLMQLMPQTAKQMGVNSIFSSDQNIRAGTLFLRYMLDAFDGDLEMSIAAYNAGPGAVRKYGKIPPYKETKNYVNNVLKYYRSYGSRRRINCYTDESGCIIMYNEK